MFAGGQRKKGKIISQQGMFEELLSKQRNELPLPTYGPSISDMHLGYNFNI